MMFLEIYLIEDFGSNHNCAHLTTQSLPSDMLDELKEVCNFLVGDITCRNVALQGTGSVTTSLKSLKIPTSYQRDQQKRRRSVLMQLQDHMGSLGHLEKFIRPLDSQY